MPPRKSPSSSPAFRLVRKPGAPYAALLQFVVALALALSTVLVGTVMSVGLARAEGVHALTEPDPGFVAALLACAVVLMSGLSAVAVRLVGRPRQR